MAWTSIGNIKGAPGTPGTGGGGGSLVVSDTAPASPADGSEWLDSTTGIKYVRYNDGNSTQWVQFGVASGAINGFMADGVAITPNGNLNYLSPVTDPPTAPTDGFTFFSRSVASRNFPAFVGPSGLDTALQPLLARNKVGYWNPSGNATTVPGVFGITAPTAVGTATSRTVSAVSGPKRMRRLGYSSATTAGALAGHRISYAQFSCGSGINDGSGFMLISRFIPSDAAVVAGKRMFVGMINSGSAPTNVEPSVLKNFIGVAQLSTDATQLYLVYGGSVSQTPIPLGTDLGNFSGLSSDAFELAVFCPNSEANTFNVQVTNIFTGVTVIQTITGNAAVIPQSSTLLTYSAWTCNNATALATAVDICSIYIETDS